MNKRRYAVVTFAIAVVVAVAVEGTPSPATAAQLPSTVPPTVVSVSDPFAPLDCGQPLSFRSRNSPREPVVAVNPADPRNIVVSYIVDSNLSNLVRSTSDGGVTWTTSTVPGISKCTLGTDALAGDPSLSFSSDGKTVYLASLTTPTSAPAGTDSVLMSTSEDGGRTWSASPTRLTPVDGLFGDKNLVTADPLLPATAYIAFERREPLYNSSSTLYFRRTDDRGLTWSAPTVVYVPPMAGLSTGNAQVLRTGQRLVVVFDRIISCSVNSCLDPTVVEDNIVYAATSDDGGAHWNAPVKLGNRTAGPGTNGVAFCGDLWASPQATAAPDGTLYASFPVSTPTASTPNATALQVVSSTDGTTWTQGAPVAAAGNLGMHAMSVAADGVVGMTYYQLENSNCGAPTDVAPVDVWFARSRDGARSWTLEKVGGPFDARGNCSFAGTPLEGCVISDYDGLTPSGAHGFAAVFEVPHARGQQTSDIVFTSLSSRH
jgi:hypothetical protein